MDGRPLSFLAWLEVGKHIFGLMILVESLYKKIIRFLRFPHSSCYSNFFENKTIVLACFSVDHPPIWLMLQSMTGGNFKEILFPYTPKSQKQYNNSLLGIFELADDKKYWLGNWHPRLKLALINHQRSDPWQFSDNAIYENGSRLCRCMAN